jgi:twinkle protein
LSDITEIKRGLASRALSVAEMLLPAGKKVGHEWEVGSTYGEQGKTLKVHLVGEKAGIWSDFATGESGDLLDLWCAVQNIKLVDALDKARSYLGVKRPCEVRDLRVPRKTFKLPPKPACVAPEGKALDYLREVRNISADAITAYKIGEQGDKIVFPYLSRDGKLILAKARVAADGQAPIPTAKECAPTLMGWHLVPHNARELVICEGEIDALSLFDYGRIGMSVPFGGGKGAKQDWITTDYDQLEAIEKFYLALDDDPVGEQACEEIASRLGRHRCYRVRLPRKDANQCLVEGISKEEIDKAFADAKTVDPEELRAPIGYADEVNNLFWPELEQHLGYHTPYEKLGFKLMFRPGEVTLVGGAAGDGKSQVVSDCVVDFVRQGARTCLLSLEMKGKFTLKRMVKQAGKIDRPTAEFVTKILQWLTPGLWIYDLVGKVNVDLILDVFDYARARYGCDVFIIDSLMRLGVASDDYVGQEKVVFQLVEWATSKNVHLILVAHSRKGDQSRGVPDLQDFKGAMEIGANAHNAIMIWRNRKHEEQLASEENPAIIEALQAEAGVIMNLCKQRNGDFEGKIGLWFDQETYRYRSSHDQPGGRNYISLIEGASHAAA